MIVGYGEAKNCWDKEIDCGGPGWKGASGIVIVFGKLVQGDMRRLANKETNSQGRSLCRAMHADELLEIFNVLTNAQAHHFFRHSGPAFRADFLA
jgi:hypothetical protein